MPKKLPSWRYLVPGAVIGLSLAWYAWQPYATPAPWTEQELGQLTSLWLNNLPPLPDDPSNAVADDLRAVELGHRLFFDPRMSGNGNISCATCHQPIRRFTDGLPKAVALGVARRNTASIVGLAYSPWLYWDGRKDSLWSQALAPLEDPKEHGGDRGQIVALIAEDDDYRNAYEALFGGLKDEPGTDHVFANIGKSIAAYERLLLPGESRFDEYVKHVQQGGDYLEQSILDADELRGLRLFIGDARCTECHNGPLFTNFEFHNTGLMPPAGELPDRGRVDGVREALQDPFNCDGEFGDDPERGCAELRHVRRGTELIGATKTPSLRNLQDTMPFQSSGRFANLAEVLEHYNEAPLAVIGHNEAKPLNLADWQLRQLEAFLHTLSAPINAEAKWLSNPFDE